MLLGNLFTHFAASSAQAAYCVNVMNALLSGGCILFLFWSITHLARKLLGTPSTLWQMLLILGCGFVGALTYAFSDTFWFSAVEGEVYAFSSFLTALTFWIILRWEDEADEPHSSRWLVLLAYVIGLSIGVHLLNLLCIPAVALVMYYRRQEHTTLKGTALALGLSFVGIATVLYGLVPGIMKMSGLFELFTVNHLGTPYYIGMVAHAFLLAAVLAGCVCESRSARRPARLCFLLLCAVLLSGCTLHDSAVLSFALTLAMAAASYLLCRVLKKGQNPSLRTTLHTLSLCLAMMVTGYSSYALIVIRSAANPPMDQQSPDNPFALRDYLGRDQYGTTPLLYGQTFASPRALERKDGYVVYGTRKGEAQYRRADSDENGGQPRYLVSGHKLRPTYQPETCVWFPRMHSADHADAYHAWLGNMQGRAVHYTDMTTGRTKSVTIPSAWDNLRFFFRYQINFMYWRYFLWNFVGRQDDVPGNGGPEHGNWLTGFSCIDSLRLGGYAEAQGTAAQGKSRNVFYALPLALGLLGMGWQIRRSEKGCRQFNIVLWLFFMTGLAIVLYLNQKPLEPRERDYAYAGSFYAFAIWIGLGTAAVAHTLGRWWHARKAVPAAVFLSLLVPLQMVGQTWDDHDRSGRYVCRDFGQNYLNSLDEKGNPVLFVNGDNETFPLWYNTEVEGIRPDARVCNLMYLAGGWYVDQMRRPAYSSPGLPVSIPRKYYRDGVNDAVVVNPIVRYTEDGHSVRLKEEVERIYREYPDKKPFGEDPWEWDNIVRYWLTSNDEGMRCIPTDEVHIRIDKEAVKRSGMLIPDGMEIPERMTIRLKDRNYLLRTGIILLDLIRQCNWERPLYVANTLHIEEYLDLSGHLLMEGFASRIVPYDVREAGIEMDTDKTYDNIMHKFRFGGLENSSVYLDHQNRIMATFLQRTMAALALELYRQGDRKRMGSLIRTYRAHLCHPQLQGQILSYMEELYHQLPTESSNLSSTSAYEISTQ